MKRKLFLTLLIVSFLFSATGAFAGAGQYPVCYNKTLAVVDTEYSQEFDAGVKKITMQCRTSFDVRFAYVTGKVATPTAPYMTMKSGAVYWEDDISTKMEKQTIYFATDEAGVVVELLVWY